MEKIIFYPITPKFNLKTLDCFLESFEEELKDIVQDQDQTILKYKKEKANSEEIENLKIRSCGNSIIEISLNSKIELLKKIREEYFISEEYQVDKLNKAIKFNSKELKKNIEKYDFKKEMEVSKELENAENLKKNLQNNILNELIIKMKLFGDVDHLNKNIKEKRCLYCGDKVKSFIFYKGFNFPYCQNHFEIYQIQNDLN